MAATKQRTVDGPEQDLLELSEVASYLRMSEPTLRRLIRLGKFPRPLEISDGVRVWSWRDILYWVLLTEIRPRLRAKTEKPNPGQERSSPDQSRSTGKRAKPEP